MDKICVSAGGDHLFYELRHPLKADYFDLETGENLDFPAHIHHCFEVVTVTEGEMKVLIDKKEYSLTPGSAVIIFPNQIHSLKTHVKSRHLLCVFSPRLVGSFSKETEGKIPENALFPMPETLRGRLEYLSQAEKTSVIKGILYSICGAFDETAVYNSTQSGHSNQLLYIIFEFIEKNYAGECSLKALAKRTAYDYAYLSKFFKKNVGLSFNDYVNHYRISQACYLLQSTDKSILETSGECGYSSVRSFNRNFKEQLTLTPKEYRKSRGS